MALDQEQDEAPGIPEWVVTFGDMMSLLLTFFIMLVSLSEIKEEEKYQALVESIRRQFGHDSAEMNLIPGDARPRNSRLSKLATMGRARRFDLMKGGDKVPAPAGDHPRVRVIRFGTKTAVGTVLTFEESSVALSPKDRRDLQVLAGEISGKPQKVEVRGHTSSRPLTGDEPYSDHWDLAYRRAKVVMAYLVNDLDIDARRIRLAVAGPYEPFSDQPDPIEQSLNPRVEVYLLDEVVSVTNGDSPASPSPDSPPPARSPPDEAPADSAP